MNTVQHQLDWRQLILAVLALVTSTLGSAWLGNDGPAPPAPPVIVEPGPTPTPTPTPTPNRPPSKPTAPDSDLASGVVERVNAYRGAYRLAPMAVDARLTRAAQAHADFMARTGRMAHEGIGDGTPWDRIKGAGYTFTSAAENVAMGQKNVDEVMASWLGSPGHRQNIAPELSNLPPYRNIGVGVAQGPSGMLFWCQDFASSSDPAPAPTPSGPGQPAGKIIEEPSASSTHTRPSEETAR